MKGIRKLFLGLILLTLFGVGFKVEAKAAADPLNLKVVQKTGGDIVIRFTGPTDRTAAGTVYPINTDNTNPATFTYKYKVVSGSTTVKTGTLALKHTQGGTPEYQYIIDGGTPQADTSIQIDIPLPKTSLPDSIFGDTGDSNVKATVLTVEMNGTATVTGTCSNATEYATTIPDNTTTINKYKFTVTPKYDKGSFPAEAATPEITATPEYAFEGDTLTATIVKTPGKGYKFSSWKDGIESPTGNPTQTFTMGTSAKNVDCIFTKDTAAVSIVDLNGKNFLKGVTSNEKTVNLTGYTYSDIKEVWINGTKLADTDVSVIPGTPAKLKFKVPSTTGKDQTFALKMSDGQVYDDYKINIVPEPTITVPTSYSIGVGDTATITPTCSVTPTSVGFKGETGYEPYFSLSETAGTITGVKTADKGYKVKATAALPVIEGYTGETTIAAETTVYVETVKFKDAIYVNKDKKVTLSDFLKSGSASTTISTLTNNADSYIEVSGYPGKASDITVKGKSSGTKDDSLVIGTDKLDVTVYPEPKLSVETTGAGSSYKQTYTVKMPKGVYHGKKDDGWWIESVSKAKLVFKASSNSDKTREVTVDSFSDSSSSDEKLLKKATKELKTSDLNVIFRDLCKNDSDTISVIAYPYNTNKDKIDTEIASEKKEFTVYKITMDTSGGANYTVNGETVSDYFYGIDGVTYEIKSSGKTANAKLNKDTSSSEFGSGETIQYKVAGARTLKAVYGGGSNNEGGGGNMDDYDDVPKTGESKADIWILWSVLFIAILGAGFMIWKRFGLVRAIAAAEEEYAIAEEEERIETEKKEKEDKLNMLKDLRNL